MQTELLFPDAWTDIPYGEEGDDPRLKHEYIDLRARPDRVGELPEVARVAGLAEALLAINGPETPFRTFGCDFVIDRGEFGEDFTHLAHSYLHVGFADPDLCFDRDGYYLLFGRLSEALHGIEEFASEAIERFYLRVGIESLLMEGEDAGTVANLSCDVFATSEAQARADWAGLIAAIADHLASERLA